MEHNTHIAALMAALMLAPVVSADTLQTGMQVLRIDDATGDRDLDGFVWYPTRGATDLVQAHGNAVWQSISVSPDADPMDGRFPLVVMSHGMFGNARNQAWLAEKLVAEGFVVAAIDHPGTSTMQRDPDQRRELWERPADISRTIDHMLDTHDLADRIDRDQVFMAGHSLGGFTAVALAGGRYDADGFDAFCVGQPDELVCGIFNAWNVAQSEEDRQAMQQDLSDPRIKAFAVFDLGGTQSFSKDSLGRVDTPMLVYGAPEDISGLDLDKESRALVAALPESIVQYEEPAGLAHFDFLGVCTEMALAILQEEEPEDVFVCEKGRAERQSEHANIAARVAAFFREN